MDFEAGQVFDSQGRTITETDVITFAGWSWDTNLVHTDEPAQATSRFGTRIAYGLLGLSIATGLASRIGVFEGCSIALLGIEQWQVTAPIFIGDTLRVQVEILSAHPTSRGDTGILERESS